MALVIDAICVCGYHDEENGSSFSFVPNATRINLTLKFNKGIEMYLKGKTLKDPCLFKITDALLSRYDIIYFAPTKSKLEHELRILPCLVHGLLSILWNSVRALGPGESDGLSGDDSQLLIWAAVFKLYCAART